MPMLPPPSAAELAAARASVPEHHEATADLHESWSVRNPRGKDIHYPTREAALEAAETGVY